MPAHLGEYVERLRQNYVLENQEDWRHFYCPILRADEPVQLCLGHVIPAGLPNSSRAVVPQRQDVDSFFGRTVESVFVDSVRTHKKSLFEIIQNPELRRFVKPSILIGGEDVEFYPISTDNSGQPVGNVGNQHALLRIENKDGSAQHFGLKVDSHSLDILTGQKELETSANVDFRAAAVGCMLHSAHLTMFRMLGYRYANSSAGMFMGDILREFFYTYSDSRNLNVSKIAHDFFWQFSNLVRPLSSRPEWALGTVDDNRLLFWEGTSGRLLGFGVLVNTAGMMHVVWLPPSDADSVAEYLRLLTTPPDTMTLRVSEFRIDEVGKGSFHVDTNAVRVLWKATEIEPYFKTQNTDD